MCRATADDLERVVDAEVPVVLCPSSNALFDRAPPLGAMLEQGVELALGTDNAMFGPADLPGEARLLLEKGSSHGLTPLKALSILLDGPKKLINQQFRIGLAPGCNGGVTVIEAPLEEPLDLIMGEGHPGRMTTIGPWETRRDEP